MLCAAKEKSGKDCQRAAWVVGVPLCELHFEQRYSASHDRLKNEMPCRRCYQAGLFRFEDGSRDLIKHNFSNQEFQALSDDQKSTVSALCSDCDGRFWVPKIKAVQL